MNYEVPLRVAIGGSVDSSKSTTIGVLKSGIFDNGNGSARENVFQFLHEKKSGRTSSVSQCPIYVNFKNYIF